MLRAGHLTSSLARRRSLFHTRVVWSSLSATAQWTPERSLFVTHSLNHDLLQRQRPLALQPSARCFSSAVEEPSKEEGPYHPTTLWKRLKNGFNHTVHSLKLLATNIRITTNLLNKMSDNHALTRREQRLLYMTTADLLRMLPFSLFLIIPGAEILLPVALKLYPGLLPSTFSTEEEEKQKLIDSFPDRFGSRKLIRDYLGDVARGRGYGDEPWLNAYIDGEPVQPDMIREFAEKLEGQVSIEKLPRAVLIASLETYGVSSRFFLTPFVPVSLPSRLLKDKLRRHINALREDDVAILREEISSLSLEELKQDNRERCMQEHTTEAKLRRQLEDWTSLTVGNPDKGVMPIDISYLIFIQPRADHFWNSIHNMPQYVIDTVMKANDTPPAIVKQLQLLVSLPKQEVNKVVDKLDDVPEIMDVQLKLGRLLLKAKARGIPIKRAFALFDFDRDGRLTKDEIRECLEELQIKVTNKEISVLFKNYDTDNDGKISLKEFMRVARDAGFIEKKIEQARKGLQGHPVTEDIGDVVDKVAASVEGADDEAIQYDEEDMDSDQQVFKKLSLFLEEEKQVQAEDEEEKAEEEEKEKEEEEKEKEEKEKEEKEKVQEELEEANQQQRGADAVPSEQDLREEFFGDQKQHKGVGKDGNKHDDDDELVDMADILEPKGDVLEEQFDEPAQKKDKNPKSDQ